MMMKKPRTEASVDFAHSTKVESDEDWSRKLLESPQTSAIDALNRKAADESNDKNVPKENDHDETGIKKATTTSVLTEDDQGGDEELIAVVDSAAEPDAVPNKHNSYAMPAVESDVYKDRTSPSIVRLSHPTYRTYFHYHVAKRHRKPKQRLEAMG
ncbi:MAG: hypothetical protein Q9198_003442 [Flavoplaca austrocitrina]